MTEKFPNLPEFGQIQMICYRSMCQERHFLYQRVQERHLLGPEAKYSTPLWSKGYRRCAPSIGGRGAKYSKDTSMDQRVQEVRP